MNQNVKTLIIFEDADYKNLLPLVYWRTVGELRIGYGRLCDQLITRLQPDEVYYYCRPELAAVAGERFPYPINQVPDTNQALLVNARLLCTAPLNLAQSPAVQWADDAPAAIFADRPLIEKLTPAALLDPVTLNESLAELQGHSFLDTPRMIRYPWDLVQADEAVLRADWRTLDEPVEKFGRIHEGVHMLNDRAIHLGRGSVVKPGTVLDAEDGPIYIGDKVTISPNCVIQGPCYIGTGSLIQPGALLREGSNIGPHCKVGGELEASIIHGYANKQHDGFVGHSYVAEWVNLAADTITSDLKNTYGTIRVPVNGIETDTGQTFVGLTIGDHSKTGIGQLFPTGAVVGFGCNVASGGLAPKFTPSFTWQAGTKARTYDLTRCIEIARKVMFRRNIRLSDAEVELFYAIRDKAADIENV
jgi:UDP-N-acetylglucosamine diphosphorylase/glucosamine-1-phosphate N-acetyltransferase